MSDGTETQSAVERLWERWRKRAASMRTDGYDHIATTYEICANDLRVALEEDGVIPTRMK